MVKTRPGRVFDEMSEFRSGQRKRNPKELLYIQYGSLRGAMSMIIPMIISTSSAGRQVTWPEGLPVNPLLPLTLVSRTFRRCAQARLFNNVRLKDQCEAYLFLQALTCTSTEESVVRSTPIDSRAEHDTTQGGELESLQSSDNSHSNLHRLTRLVRSIQFAWNGPSSMGMGGGSLICDIVRSCPLLKDIAIRIPFLDHCEEPLLEALKSRPLVKKILIYADIARCNALQSQEAVTRLFNSCDSLETVDLSGICGWPVELDHTLMKPIPTMNCALQTIILLYPQLDYSELSCFLKSSLQSMPDASNHSTKVEAEPDGLMPNPEGIDPAKNRGLFDIVFKSSSAPLRKIKYLNISGNLVGSEFFNLLPQSIVTLDLDDCRISGTAFSNALSSWRGIDGVELPTGPTCPQSQSRMDERLQWLHNLRSCSIPNEHKWSWRTRKDIWTKMQARGVDYRGDWRKGFHWMRDKEHNEDEDEDDQGKGTDGSDCVSDETSSDCSGHGCC
ncbi:hypothetical protein H4Q26_007539 [Puccinia striiformis f. sp. tritici PST-130]|nr:hypothetical protein H4Q26_007539 [Puccinia striiformis f. sp. tritici PST-130]